MTHVRIGKDVLTRQIGGVDWVFAHSGGVSTFSSQGPGPNWWLLPAGFDYPVGLRVVNDHGNHHSWEADSDLALADYTALLAAVEPAFRKVS
jgi:hypothetical protein